MNTEPTIVTRIAPSPTGLLRIGTARTALFNYLYARQHNGRFIMRIEDTDRERSKAEYEENIREGLAWLGLTADESVRQSERTELYTKALSHLVETNAAYVSEEPAKDDPSKTVAVVRLRNPGRVVTFTDVVRGEITFDTTELGDFVVARSMEDPLYHLAVVVDDAKMGVTHVIRGEDHISNTPRQILIQEALGYTRPTYAHLPLILAPDRSKMSKRKGAVSISEYRDQGYLADALLNYLALLGWNPGDDREVFTLEELVEAFSLEQVQKGGAVFDLAKLGWLNREHRRRLEPSAQLNTLLVSVPSDEPIVSLVRGSDAAARDALERFNTSAEFYTAIQAGEYDFFASAPTVDASVLVFKKDTQPERVPEHLERLATLLQELDTTAFTEDGVKSAVWDYAEQEGRGSVLWPLRVALSGMERSPSPFVLAEALGKEETLARLRTARACFD